MLQAGSFSGDTMIGNQTPSVQTTSMKLADLKRALEAMHSALVAFSGGVDSTFLLKVARDVLGSRVLAATASSPTYPAHETEAAVQTAEALGVEHMTLTTAELGDPKFRENSPQRCYWCKRELFSLLKNSNLCIGKSCFYFFSFRINPHFTCIRVFNFKGHNLFIYFFCTPRPGHSYLMSS